MSYFPVPKYREYLHLFRGGAVLSRRMVADALDLPYSTVVYNLDRAVANGELNRAVYGLESGQSGWAYALPDTMPRLEGT